MNIAWLGTNVQLCWFLSPFQWVSAEAQILQIIYMENDDTFWKELYCDRGSMYTFDPVYIRENPW